MTEHERTTGPPTAEAAEFATPNSETPEGKRTLRKAIGASAMGNAVEWFDYGVYGVMVVYISSVFFPGDQATVWALGTFAVSFLVRPLGGLFWGPLGDRIGRKAVLAITILLMAAATFVIGLLPSYDSVGWLSPALLIFLRLIQGFSTGGEYGGAATFMAEYAPDRKRGFYGSFLEFGTLAGFALGTLIALICEITLGAETMADWGWRIPFLIAGPLGLIGWYLRTKLEDTPVFREAEQKGETESSAGMALKDLLTKFWRPMLAMGGLVVALNVVNYTLLAYMPTYLQDTINMDADATLTVVLIGQLVMMVLIPFFGKLSDRVGRKPLWWTSLIGLFVLALPLYMMMAVNFWLAMLAFAILGLLYIPQLATISATFPSLFPTHVRYAGFAITYNTSTALFGGTAPAVNEAIIEATGISLVPAMYMMAACLIGMVAMFGVPETAGVSLRGREVPGRKRPRWKKASA
ncbi:MFS transporter [uncultured Arthrobacter sp.]|uniref:MFS transporter n=1 Tax=uncultured Arthrobacter sp. TaxID=114050 RepID=UPI002611F8A2|nr:MFS transporter [uncultured Arthrobacter sp.]